MVEAQRGSADGPSRLLVGRWRSVDARRSATKSFDVDGAYRESYYFLGARVAITGVYRVEENKLLWTGRKLFIDRRGGDIRPSTKDMHLNQEQTATIHWRGADELVIFSDRATAYKRVRP